MQFCEGLWTILRIGLAVCYPPIVLIGGELLQLSLCEPSLMNEATWRDLQREYQEFNEPVVPYALFGDFDDYSLFMEATTNNAHGINLRDGFVPNKLLLLKTSSGKIVGAIDLRFHLNEYLETHIGHIGYGIRPTERNKGFGTRALALALDQCRRNGLCEVILTCDSMNTASQKVILKNGGQFIEQIRTNSGLLFRYKIIIYDR